MFLQSQVVVDSAIESLLKNIWVGVGFKNAEKMTPTNVRLMNIYTFQTLAEQNSEKLQSPSSIPGIEDQKGINFDTLLSNFIRLQKKARAKSEANQLLSKTRLSIEKRLQSRNKNSIENNSNTSNRNSKTKESKEEKFVDIHKLIEDLSPNSPSVQYDVNRSIEYLRQRIIKSEQFQLKEEKDQQKQNLQKLERLEALKKKKKQMVRFTYDYEGDVINSKNWNPEQTLGGATRIKSECNRESEASVKKVEKKKIPFTTLINEKLQERYKKIANQNMQIQKNSEMYTQSLQSKFANSFSNDDKLSEGISIKEASSNFYRIKPFNRAGQKATLAQFKRQNINRRFKQFKIKAVRTVEASQNYVKNKLGSYKSEQNFHDKKQKTMLSELSQKVPDSHQIKIRHKTIFGSQQVSLLSPSKLDRQSRIRGTIKVTNPSLYNSVINDD